jgi:drug/metabolite transporter (DMT)-like permease
MPQSYAAARRRGGPRCRGVPEYTAVVVVLLSSAAAAARRAFVPGLLLAVTGAILFSGKAIVVKLAYRYGVDAETLIALRMLFALPFFVVALAWTSRGAPALRLHDHGRLVVIGLLGYYAASYFDFLGLQYVTAALERLILYLNPTIVLLLSLALLGKRITRADGVALALSYAGILLVFVHDVRLEGDHVALGSALVFLATLCYAAYLVLSGELVARIGAIRLTSYAMCVATIAVMLQFALVRPWSNLLAAPEVLWLSAFNGLFCTVLPVFATMMAVQRIGAGSTALAGMVGPVATIGLGYVFLGEAITGWQLAGTALVLAGVLVLSRKGRVASAADD